MKTQKLLICIAGSLALMYTASVAQPVLTAGGINPVIGDSHTDRIDTWANPGSSGANQTWDLSSMFSFTTRTFTAVNPASTSWGSYFPSSNVAWQVTSSDIGYYKTSSAALQFYGFFGQPYVLLSFSNPEDCLHFPFSYNNTFSDTYYVEYEISEFDYWAQMGYITVTADGYGTLITPNGTYSNVMRLHITKSVKDSSLTMEYVYHQTGDIYQWYKDGIHFPLATVTSWIPDGGVESKSGSYATGTNLGIEDNNETFHSFEIFPNPVMYSFQLRVQPSMIGSAYTITDILGQSVMTGKVIEKNSLVDISALPAGLYFLNVGEEQKQTVKIIKQ